MHAVLCAVLSSPSPQNLFPFPPQELTFEVGPTPETRTLRAALYALSSEEEAPSGDQFLGSGRWGRAGRLCSFTAAPVCQAACGAAADAACPLISLPLLHCSLSLARLGELEAQRHVRVPLVSPSGSHAADVSLDLRFFHSRSPGERSCGDCRELAACTD